MTRKITLLPGDGIGPEVTAAAVRVIEAAAGELEWESHAVGIEALEQGGAPLPDTVLESIRHNKVCLKGPVTTPVGKGFRSLNVTLRQVLDLFACVRPVRYFQGVPAPTNLRVPPHRFVRDDLILIGQDSGAA